MKKISIYILVAVVFVATIIGITYVFRSLASVATPINVFTPKTGITCVSMVTADGVALSCIKD